MVQFDFAFATAFILTEDHNTRLLGACRSGRPSRRLLLRARFVQGKETKVSSFASLKCTALRRAGLAKFTFHSISLK
jgi:hypothetical protein